MPHSCLGVPTTFQGGLTPDQWSCLLPWHHLLISWSSQYYQTLPVWSNSGTTEAKWMEASIRPTPFWVWLSTRNTSHQCKEGVMLFWAGQMHTTPTPQGWQCHGRCRAVVKQALGSSIATEISSFLSHIAWDTIPPGLRLVLRQKGVMKSLLLSAEPIHGIYLGCASPAAQSHTKLQLFSKPTVCICSRGQGEVWGHHWHCTHRRWGWKDAELSRLDL